MRMQHAAAASPFFGADPAPPEREALLEAGRLGWLGELVRGVAHEINNPLFGILGLVDVLLGDSSRDRRARPAAPRPAERARDQAHHAFAAPVRPCRARRRGRSRCTGSPRRPSSSSAARTRTRTSSCERSYCREPLDVHGNPARLSQVFLSLLVNAQQALPGGGTVTVRLERDGEWAVASVTDTGKGIDPIHPQASVRAVHDDEGGRRARARGEPRDRPRARRRPGRRLLGRHRRSFVLRLPLAGDAS